MTHEQIDELEPGRELDETIHCALWPEDEVLQLPWADSITRQYRRPKTNELQHQPWLCLPHYSTSIADAWTVLDRLRVIDFRHVTLEMAGGCWRCDISPYNQNETFSSFGYSAPLAICRAALKAIAHQPS